MRREGDFGQLKQYFLGFFWYHGMYYKVITNYKKYLLFAFCSQNSIMLVIYIQNCFVCVLWILDNMLSTHNMSWNGTERFLKPFEVSTIKSKNVIFGCNIGGFVALLKQKHWEFAHKKYFLRFYWTNFKSL